MKVYGVESLNADEGRGVEMEIDCCRVTLYGHKGLAELAKQHKQGFISELEFKNAIHDLMARNRDLIKIQFHFHK